MLDSTWEGLPRPTLLSYGRLADLAAPLVRVPTWWPRDRSGEPPIEYELGLAGQRDSAVGRRDWAAVNVPLVRLPAGPFAESHADVLAGSDHRRVRVVSWKHYDAFRFSLNQSSALVVRRHPHADPSSFEVVANHPGVPPLLTSPLLACRRMVAPRYSPNMYELVRHHI